MINFHTHEWDLEVHEDGITSNRKNTIGSQYATYLPIYPQEWEPFINFMASFDMMRHGKCLELSAFTLTRLNRDRVSMKLIGTPGTVVLKFGSIDERLTFISICTHIKDTLQSERSVLGV